MKINNGILLMLVISMGIALSGCHASVDKDSSAEYSNEERNIPKVDDLESHEYDENSAFEIVHYEKIRDGSLNGVGITILVHRETGVMYMQTSKFQAGYGMGLEVMLDENGKPLVHESYQD